MFVGMYVCGYVCLWVCMFVGIYVCGYVCLWVCMFVGMYVCGYVCLWVCMFVGMYFCGYVCLWVCMFVGIYVCGYLCLWVCMFVGMYVCGYLCLWVFMFVGIYVCGYACSWYLCMYVHMTPTRQAQTRVGNDDAVGRVDSNEVGHAELFPVGAVRSKLFEASLSAPTHQDATLAAVTQHQTSSLTNRDASQPLNRVEVIQLRHISSELVEDSDVAFLAVTHYQGVVVAVDGHPEGLDARDAVFEMTVSVQKLEAAVAVVSENKTSGGKEDSR